MNDLISRQAAIDAIDRLILPQTKGETAAEEINRVAWRCAINCAEEIIGHLPTIDPVKHGKWIEKDYNRICSVCGATFWKRGADAWNYCPTCGAAMKKGGE